jgi:single-stranded DNA-binding protein
LRIQVEAADDPGAFALAAVMKSGAEVIVEGRLKAIRRRLKSGLTETAYEVVAESIEAAEPVGRIK